MPVSMKDFSNCVAMVNEALKGLRELNDLEYGSLDKRVSNLEDIFGRSLDLLDDIGRRVLELEREMAELRLKEDLRDSIKVAS